jgi:hypothetical protein
MVLLLDDRTDPLVKTLCLSKSSHHSERQRSLRLYHALVRGTRKPGACRIRVAGSPAFADSHALAHVSPDPFRVWSAVDRQNLIRNHQVAGSIPLVERRWPSFPHHKPHPDGQYADGMHILVGRQSV